MILFRSNTQGNPGLTCDQCGYPFPDDHDQDEDCLVLWDDDGAAFCGRECAKEYERDLDSDL